MNPTYLPITCRSVRPTAPQKVPTVDEKCRIMRQLEDDCMTCTIATNITIEAEKDKKEVTLPPEYQRYASVFSEEEAQRFPPSRAWDHAIDFKKGVPDAINCPVYPMTRTEDEALDNFIDNNWQRGIFGRPSPLMLCLSSSSRRRMGSCDRCKTIEKSTNGRCVTNTLSPLLPRSFTTWGEPTSTRSWTSDGGTTTSE